MVTSGTFVLKAYWQNHVLHEHPVSHIGNCLTILFITRKKIAGYGNRNQV